MYVCILHTATLCLSYYQDDTPTTTTSGSERRSGSSSPDPNTVDHPLAPGRGMVTESGSSQKVATSCEADTVAPKTGAAKQGALNGASDGYTLPEVDSSVTSLDHEDLRLRGAVYFGYGLLNIIVSLIPPKLMKVANLFGFRGSRRVGLQALEFSSKSQDAKAPLARCVLSAHTCNTLTYLYVNTYIHTYIHTYIYTCASHIHAHTQLRYLVHHISLSNPL